MYIGTEPFLIDILEEHFETLQWLYRQRRLVLGSDVDHAARLGELDERWDAHLDGLVLAGRFAVPMLAAAAAEGDDAAAFCAAFGLLRGTDPVAFGTVMDAFDAAEGPTLDGLRDALCRSNIDAVVGRLDRSFEEGTEAAAVAAAEVLAFHGRLAATSPRLSTFLHSDDANVRRSAWRVVALCDQCFPGERRGSRTATAESIGRAQP